MAIKKSGLYSSLWASCDELRGGMDASQYKDYVLFMLFIKYVSDKYGNSDAFAPAVVIPKGASFSDMVALKGKSDIGDRINTQIIQPLIDANERLARTDFPDFNDPNKLGEGQAMVDRLTNLIGIFQKPELDFSQNRAEHDDILGDAYEYLMRHFATESGKSKGQFYTPAEVSRVIARVIGITPQNAKASTTAYDPTCGSGSLLLKVAAQSGKQITLEGQEKDVTTAGLARMNMILHDFPTANILNGNTLAAPKFKDGEQLRTYDYVVANPPFSDKTWGTGLTPVADPFQRFAWGVPPAKQGDYAYLLHILRSMKGAGKAACVLPHGVLFRGNAEGVIRQQLVRSGILKGIVGLPANLFYGTGIPACIVVLDKENAAARKGVFMIDASRGFIKDGPKNRLREQDIHRIVDTFTRQLDTPHYARLVPLAEIADPKNDYNLNLPRYIDSSEPEDLHDIEGHLRGGIPERDLDALADYWQVLPGVRAALFESAGRPGYARLKLPLPEVRPAILGHAEFTAFNQTVTKRFDRWRKSATAQLTAFGKDGHPKALIEGIAEDLLATFREAPLLRRLRRLPAPDGLLGGDDAGRRLPDRGRRLGGANVPHPGDRQEGQEEGQGLDLRADPQAPRRRALLRGRAGEPRGQAGGTRSLHREPGGTGGGARRRRRLPRRARQTRQARGQGAAEGDPGRPGGAGRDRRAGALVGAVRERDRTQARCEGAGGGARQAGVWQVPDAHRSGDPGPSGRRQVDDPPVRRRAGGTGARFPDPDRPHPPAGRTLRHAAAAANRRSGDPCRSRGDTHTEDAGVMPVRPGYKPTAVGPIPTDWAVHALGDLTAVVTKGTTPTSLGRAFTASGIRFLKAESISESGQPILEKIAFIDEETHRLLRRSQLAAGDILVSIAGVLGRIGVVEPEHLPANTNQALAIVRLGSGLHSMLAFHALRGPVVQAQIRNISVQAAQANISLQDVRDLLVPLPSSVPERRAIATALSDVDALLDGLDRLIAKKRDLKQAAMQQLLTGQTRLPGFHGEWEASTVGSEFEIALGKMLNAETNAGTSKPYIGNRAVQWGRIDVLEVPEMLMSPADLERYRLLSGDLLVCEGGEVGRAAIWDAALDECYYQKALHRLRPVRGFNVHLMAALFEYWADRGLLKNYVTQTSIAHLPREKLIHVPLMVPTEAEQTAIAGVLSNMDAELAALEAQRDKTRALKQAMMQELLTGRTRLV